MGGAHPHRRNGVGWRRCVAGTEVGSSLVRTSPALSLAGGPSSTRDCRRRGEPETGRSANTIERVPKRGLHAGNALQEGAMQVLYPRCAGLDVHKDQVVACMRWIEGREVR